MREAVIILPTKADPRRPETQESLDRAHRLLMRALVEEFGGVSVYEGFGAWIADSGEMIEEPHKRYVVAVSWDGIEEEGRKLRCDILEGIAGEAAWRGGQDCVYVRYPDGKVSFVKPLPA